MALHKVLHSPWNIIHYGIFNTFLHGSQTEQNAQQEPTITMHGFLRSLNLLTCHFEICFYNPLNTFGSKMFLTLKIKDFDNVSLTKIVHIYVIEGMNA
jgi:hypothetical protein